MGSTLCGHGVKWLNALYTSAGPGHTELSSTHPGRGGVGSSSVINTRLQGQKILEDFLFRARCDKPGWRKISLQTRKQDGLGETELLVRRLPRRLCG